MLSLTLSPNLLPVSILSAYPHPRFIGHNYIKGSPSCRFLVLSKINHIPLINLSLDVRRCFKRSAFDDNIDNGPYSSIK